MEIELTIECKKCDTRLPASAFQRLKTKPGYATWCLFCKNLYASHDKLRQQRSHASRARRVRTQNPSRVFGPKRKYGDGGLLTHWESKFLKPKFEESHRIRAEQFNVLGRTRGDCLKLEDWFRIRDYYDARCLNCGTSKSLHCDHVIPLSQGGANKIWNVQPLCRDCNLDKGIKIIDYRAAFPKALIQILYAHGLSFDEIARAW